MRVSECRGTCFDYSKEHVLIITNLSSDKIVKKIIRRSRLIDGQREESGDEEFSDLYFIWISIIIRKN